MAARWICDGCGTWAPGEPSGQGWVKPFQWYQRVGFDGRVHDACSRRCIDRIAADTGKTGEVLP